MSVIKKFDKKELAERQQEAETAFRNRINGISAITAEEASRYITGASLIKGAIEAVFCPSVHMILPTYNEKLAQGYKLHESLDLTSVGPIAFEFYLVRPEADIQKDLLEVFKQVEDAYRAEIEATNKAILAKEIESQIQREIRAEEKVAQEAAQARRERVTAEVKQALGAK